MDGAYRAPRDERHSADYELSRVERVVSASDVEREAVYAGLLGSVDNE
jgi:hypothetical protein